MHHFYIRTSRVPLLLLLASKLILQIFLYLQTDGFPSDGEVESKMAFQRSKQRELISQLKHQLQELEAYAYETGSQDLPQSVLLQRQNIVISKYYNEFCNADCIKMKVNTTSSTICRRTCSDNANSVLFQLSENFFFSFNRNPRKMSNTYLHCNRRI